MCGSASKAGPDILGSVLNSVPVGVVVADLAGRFLFFNREAKNILGIGAQDVGPAEWPRAYGCYLPDRVTPYPADRLPLTRAILGETVTDQLVYIKNSRQSSGLWISVSGRPWRDGDDAPIGGVIIFSDVTLSRHAKEMTQFREQLLAALDQTADSVVITDKLGTIEYVNPAFEVMTGYTRGEALGKSPRILKSDLQDKAFYRNLWDTITNGRTFQGTLANRKKTGELFWTQQTITPMKDETGDITHFVSVWKDITELLRQQEKEVEMRLARDIQRQYFGTPPSVAGLDIARSSYPAHETGGDYCDFFSMADGRLGIVISDVSGHGISAALITAEIRAYLRVFALERTDPGAILTLLNRAFASDFQKGRFASTLLLCLDTRTGSLKYANAGHPYGWVLGPSGEIEHTLESTGPPLGALSDFVYSTVRIAAVGDDRTLMLITDGIVDALAVEDIDLGMLRATQYVAEHATESAADIAEGLCQVALGRAATQAYADDVTSIILKTNCNSST